MPTKKASNKSQTAKSKTAGANKRRFIRFKPDPGAIALLDFKNETNFSPDDTALIVEESQGGAGLLLISPRPFQAGQKLVAQVGLLAPLKSEVRWCRNIHDNVYQIGIQYLE